MRAPRWFRDFFAWRWAPSVSLCAAALAFVALALLFIPPEFEAPARPAVPVTRTELVAPAPVIPVARAPETVVPREAPPPPSTPISLPKPPDFAANIADRGDRPLRSAAR